MNRLLFISLLCLLAATSLAATNRAPLTATDLLDEYAATQTKLQSFSLRYDDEYRAAGGLRVKVGSASRPAVGGHFGEFRTDGQRCFRSEKDWGEPGGAQTGILTRQAAATDPRCRVLLWDGVNRWQYLHSNLTPDRDILFFVPQGHQDARGDDLLPTSRCRALFGYFEDTQAKAPYGFQRIDTELRQAESMTLLAETQTLGRAQCRVITARSAQSDYRVWIDLEHDCHIARAEIRRGGTGIAWGQGEESSLFVYLRNVKFARADGIWVPVEADTGVSWQFKNNARLDEDHHLKITQFTRTPSQDPLRDYAPDFIRTGTGTSVIGRTGQYQFRDGRIVDRAGNVLFDSHRRPANTNSNQSIPAAGK